MRVNHRGSQEVKELHDRIEELEAENRRLREAQEIADRRHAADIATINILGEENRRLRELCHPAAEVMPDGLRLTSLVHVGREASDRIAEIEAEVQALKDQRLSWCRAADENRRHAVRLEAENKQLRAQLEAARDACKLTRGSKAALAKALGQHL